MTKSFATSELEAYLDDALPAADLAALEDALRRDAALGRQLAEVIQRRDAGVHSLGAIWRRARLTCPSREQLGSYLLAGLPDKSASYVKFHLEVIGCRYCAANVADLQRGQAGSSAETQQRRRKFFQSSAGLLQRG
ncbi:MAG: hypothetical protein BMS9Abin04_442 [Planctomycetia bacterium]|nr:MAG: hypothetical protein BMS9Abin04_442 [Planctomycetia bacterium]